MNEAALGFLEAIQSRLVSGSLTTCSRHAAHKRLIPDIVTEEVGSFSTRYTPWSEQMMDSTASFNYAMKGAQLGVTEVLINLAFFILDIKQRNVLYVLPTSLIAGNFSKARFSPALKTSPKLQEMFTDTNRETLKVAGRAVLYITGSRGEGNLKEKPANVLLLDEIDAMDQKAVWRALERLSGKPRDKRMVWGISTPTIPNYGIHKLYLTGTQEHYMFPCPHCEKQIELTKDNLVICGDSITDPEIRRTHLKCVKCSKRLEHRDKPHFLKAAEWVPKNPNCDSDRRSFHVNQLYSYTIEPFEIAEAHFRGLTSEQAAQELHNSKYGIPRLGDGAKITDDLINNCIGDYRTDTFKRPETIHEQFNTLGVDKGKICHYVVLNWRFGEFGRDLNNNATAALVDFGTFPEQDYDKRIAEIMLEWQVRATVLDPDPGPNDARRVAKVYPGYAWLCRYREGKTGNEMSISDQVSGAPTAVVDKVNWVSNALRRFKTNRITVPQDMTDELREHIKNPVFCYVRREKKTEAGLIVPGPMVLEYLTDGADHYTMALTYAEIGLPLGAMNSQQAQNISEYL